MNSSFDDGFDDGFDESFVMPDFLGGSRPTHQKHASSHSHGSPHNWDVSSIALHDSLTPLTTVTNLTTLRDVHDSQSAEGRESPHSLYRMPSDDFVTADAHDRFADTNDDGYADDGFADDGFADDGFADDGFADDGFADAHDGNQDWPNVNSSGVLSDQTHSIRESIHLASSDAEWDHALVSVHTPIPSAFNTLSSSVSSAPQIASLSLVVSRSQEDEEKPHMINTNTNPSPNLNSNPDRGSAPGLRKSAANQKENQLLLSESPLTIRQTSTLPLLTNMAAHDDLCNQSPTQQLPSPVESQSIPSPTTAPLQEITSMQRQLETTPSPTFPTSPTSPLPSLIQLDATRTIEAFSPSPIAHPSQTTKTAHPVNSSANSPLFHSSHQAPIFSTPIQSRGNPSDWRSARYGFMPSPISIIGVSTSQSPAQSVSSMAESDHIGLNTRSPTPPSFQSTPIDTSIAHLRKLDSERAKVERRSEISDQRQAIPSSPIENQTPQIERVSKKSAKKHTPPLYNPFVGTVNRINFPSFSESVVQTTPPEPGMVKLLPTSPYTPLGKSSTPSQFVGSSKRRGNLFNQSPFASNTSVASQSSPSPAHASFYSHAGMDWGDETLRRLQPSESWMQSDIQQCERYFDRTGSPSSESQHSESSGFSESRRSDGDFTSDHHSYYDRKSRRGFSSPTEMNMIDVYRMAHLNPNHTPDSTGAYLVDSGFHGADLSGISPVQQIKVSDTVTPYSKSNLKTPGSSMHRVGDEATPLRVNASPVVTRSIIKGATPGRTPRKGHIQFADPPVSGIEANKSLHFEVDLPAGLPVNEDDDEDDFDSSPIAMIQTRLTNSSDTEPSQQMSRIPNKDPGFDTFSDYSFLALQQLNQTEEATSPTLTMEDLSTSAVKPMAPTKQSRIASMRREPTRESRNAPFEPMVSSIMPLGNSQQESYSSHSAIFESGVQSSLHIVTPPPSIASKIEAQVMTDNHPIVESSAQK
eukprot:TRINITY_DN4872_c0_g1_i6.p1 TRINITY_DN4872_c0_g1~~TRINITY_DN4872_c0_g1_i6.p1  ORF type:complete len:979 (-),score=204.20 TRINITY_DN4872_c0_g1_i6:1121-4057(-)